MSHPPVPASVMVDTNVLVYLTEAKAPQYEAAFQTVSALERSGVSLWISRQILREFIATRSREQLISRPVPVDLLELMVIALCKRFSVAEDGPDVTENLFRLMHAAPTGGKQVHDANIVATMMAHGISHVLTHNVSDFTRFENFVTVLSLQEAESPLTTHNSPT